MRGAVSIPDHACLLRELRLLERRTSPSGKDTIDHGKNGSDDYANSLCGCIAITLKEPREVIGELMGPGAKIFGADGQQLNAPPPVPKQPVPVMPAALAGVQLDEAAQKRLEAFKANFLRERGSIAFYGKCFGAHER